MSTNIFTGFTNDKTSSRVTHPPGGYSNNIFGGPVEPPKPKAAAPAPEAAAAQQQQSKPAQPTESQPAPVQAPKKEEAPAPVPAPAPFRRANPQMKSSIVFGYDEPTPAPSNAKATVNPITGQVSASPAAPPPKEEPKPAQNTQTTTAPTTNENEQSRKPIHTSSKVLQPPGGKSHQLW